MISLYSLACINQLFALKNLTMKGFCYKFSNGGLFYYRGTVSSQLEHFFNTYPTYGGFFARDFSVEHLCICEARWPNAAVPGSNPSLTPPANGKLLTVPGVGTHVRIYITVYIYIYIYVYIRIYIYIYIYIYLYTYVCVYFTQVMESSGCRVLF
jgi:hypothetical protein